MKITNLLVVISAAVILAACAKEPGCTTRTPGNKEIYDIMAENYLYNQRATDMKPDYSLNNHDFFYSLLSASPLNNDGKHPDRYGNDYFYSFTEQISESNAPKPTYGMGYLLYELGSGATPIRVLHTFPNSVIEQAGIKRGEWVLKINGQNMSPATLDLLSSREAVTMEVCTAEYDSQINDLTITSTRTVQVAAATVLEVDPILFASVVAPSPGNIVGYLHYLEFATGPASEGFDPANGAYVRNLRSLFAQFKSAGITDLVVDLRYNSGGYLDCCTLLASMIVDQTALGKHFTTIKYNDRSEQVNFLNAADVPNNLNLDRLFVLVSNETASASELLINTLSPYIDVTVIGTTTEGKNVGSEEFIIPEYDLKLHPITAQLFNANGESENYKNGFTPDIIVEDTWDLNPMKELGNPDERLLSVALGEITGIAPAPALVPAVPLQTKANPNVRSGRRYVTPEKLNGLILK